MNLPEVIQHLPSNSESVGLEIIQRFDELVSEFRRRVREPMSLEEKYKAEDYHFWCALGETIPVITGDQLVVPFKTLEFAPQQLGGSDTPGFPSFEPKKRQLVAPAFWQMQGDPEDQKYRSGELRRRAKEFQGNDLEGVELHVDISEAGQTRVGFGSRENKDDFEVNEGILQQTAEVEADGSMESPKTIRAIQIIRAIEETVRSLEFVISHHDAFTFRFKKSVEKIWGEAPWWVRSMIRGYGLRKKDLKFVPETIWGLAADGQPYPIVPRVPVWHSAGANEIVASGGTYSGGIFLEQFIIPGINQAVEERAAAV